MRNSARTVALWCRGLRAHEDLDRVADADRPICHKDSADGTAPALESRLEREDFCLPVHLADMRAWLALAVYTQGDAADPQLSSSGKARDIGETIDRDLLAEVAKLETEIVESRAVEDHYRSTVTIRVRVANDPAADASGHLSDGTRVRAMALMQIQRNYFGGQRRRAYAMSATCYEDPRAARLERKWRVWQEHRAARGTPSYQSFL